MRKYQDYSKFTEDELNQSLGANRIDTWSNVLACDELLKRNLPIQGLSRAFEKLFQGLSRVQLQKIDQEDYTFSKATVYAANHELQRRRLASLKWFYDDGEQHGPYNRFQLDKEFQGPPDSKTLIWKEGMKAWREFQDMPHLSQPYFFDQIIDAQSQSGYTPQPIRHEKSKNSGTALFLGIMQFIAAPFWIGIAIWTFISGFWSVTGLVLPFILAFSFCLLSVPLGLALIAQKKWAFQLRVVIGIITLLWFLSRYFIDSASFVWVMMAAYEVMLLSLLTLNQEEFGN